VFESTRNVLARLRTWIGSPLLGAISAQTRVQQSQQDFLIRAEWARSKSVSRNPLNSFGAKYFSQSDEDGITLEIIRRLGIEFGTFAELGVGDGLENNTLILLANGWRGFWIGGQDLAFDHKINARRLAFFKAWVSLENIGLLMHQGFREIAIKDLDVLSLDLDGNDYFFARELLKSGFLPKLFILEYNSKFPPPIKWTIKYEANHSWDGTDYFGASLASFCELLSNFSYSLVCCNAATGANAFFVKNDYLSCFPDLPKTIDDIFIGPQYELPERWGHRPSSQTIQRMLQIDQSIRSPNDTMYS
jgi:hypothetical protein